jgi:hypothetical protein
LVGLARAGAVAGAGGVVLGSFLPWVVSGQATRNSFSTVRTARTLELIDSSTANAVLAGWFLVPLVAAIVLLLAVLGRRRSLAALAGSLGLAAGGFALFVRLSPVETAIGPTVTLMFAVVTAASAAGLLVGRPRTGPGAEPTSPSHTRPVR